MKKFYLSLVLAMVCVLGLEAQTPAELRAQFVQSIQTYQKKGSSEILCDDLIVG